MFNLLTWLAMAGAVVSRTLAAICFTKAAQFKGRTLAGWFVLGNVVGVGYPICTTLALHGNHPNLVFATMAGFGGIFFALTIDRVFADRLSARQWMAILIIVAATMVLQIPATATSVTAAL